MNYWTQSKNNIYVAAHRGFRSQYPENTLEILKEHKLDLDINYKALTKENLDLLHAEGIEVNCWTVDLVEYAEPLIEMGVDYITSNILE